MNYYCWKKEYIQIYLHAQIQEPFVSRVHADSYGWSPIGFTRPVQVETACWPTQLGADGVPVKD